VRRAIAWLGVIAVAGAVVAATVGSGSGSPGRADARVHGALGDVRLFVDPRTPAATQVQQDTAAGDARDAEMIGRIAAEPSATWLGAGAAAARAQATDVTARARAASAVPVFVLYDIPGRDCGGASAGGAGSAGAYRAWVDAVTRGMGRRRRAIAIVEPDAVAHVAAGGCLSAAKAAEREALLSYAVGALRRRTRAWVYLDAGNPGWVRAEAMAPVLRRAGVDRADGFALNVASFYTMAQNRRYGRSLSRRLGGAHFVIDTSRNGNGAYTGPQTPRWCNPPGRALGTPPTTTATGDRLVDALLWVKYPGASDGECRPGDPPAGQWWPEYALGLAAASRS
jgi:endoglucanase